LGHIVAYRQGGATNLKVGGEYIERWRVNTGKTLTFDKGGHDPPPTKVAPPLPTGHTGAYRPTVLV